MSSPPPAPPSHHQWIKEGIHLSLKVSLAFDFRCLCDVNQWDCCAPCSFEMEVFFSEQCAENRSFSLRPIALHNSLLHMSHCLCCSTWGFHKDDSPLGWYQRASISSSCTAAGVKLERRFMCFCSSSGTRASLKFSGRLADTCGSYIHTTSIHRLI